MSGLRTFSGLVVVIGAALFVISNDSVAGGESTKQVEDDSRFPAAVTGSRAAVTSHLMFYLVDSQGQADLVAAEEYQIWADYGQIGMGIDRHSRVLFATTPGEEATAHRFIIQEIGATRLPPVVTILDRRGSD